MSKREFLETVFRLAPNEANAIMDAFDEYVDSNEPHWIPVTERLPEDGQYILAYYPGFECGCIVQKYRTIGNYGVVAWMPAPEPYKEVTS